MNRSRARLVERAMRWAFPIAAALLVGAQAVQIWGPKETVRVHEAFYADEARTLQADLVPRAGGVNENHNTPPLYVWVLAVWGRLVGWELPALRVLSFVAYLVVGVVVHSALRGQASGPARRVSVLLWYGNPLAILIGCSVNPDIFLALGVACCAWATMRRNPWALGASILVASMVKPLALAWFLQGRRWNRTALLACGAVFVVAFFLTGGTSMLAGHFGGRGLGWGAWAHLPDAIMALLGASFLLLPFAWKAPRWLWIQAVVLVPFFLYAARPWHPYEYYLLPAVIPLCLASAWGFDHLTLGMTPVQPPIGTADHGEKPAS